MKRMYRLLILSIAIMFLFGCSAAFDLAMTGAGKTAQIENNGFFNTTDDLIPGGPGLPDYYYILPNLKLDKYKKVVIADFSSRTSDVGKISSLQISEFKNLRQDIPNNLAQTFNGSIFPQCVRIDRIDLNNTKNIKNLRVDAVLFGNISEFKTGSRDGQSRNMLTATQVEMKLVDIKTRQEVLKIINRSSTDSDKISMPIVQCFSSVVNEVKSIGTQLETLRIGKYEVRVSDGNVNNMPSFCFYVYDNKKRVNGVAFSKNDPEDMKQFQSFKKMDNKNKVIFVKDVFQKYANFKFEE